MNAMKPEKIFLLIHPVLGNISDAEVTAAIPAHLQGIPYEFLRLEEVSLTNEDLGHADFEHLRRLERQAFETRFKPILDKNPNRHILYFGKSPIPLAVHLGALFGSWERIDAMYNHHDTKNWYYSGGGKFAAEVRKSQISQSKAKGPIVVRLSTSAKISPESTAPVVSFPLAEIDIETDQMGRDICDGRITKEIVSSFRKLFDEIHAKYPNRTGIHLFAAAPMGLMFEIGAGLTPSMHYPISLYQHFSANSPAYREAFTLSTRGNTQASLNPQEKLNAVASLKTWQEELEKLKSLATSLRDNSSGQCWLDRLFPGETYGIRLDRNFCLQPTLGETRISETSISPNTYELQGEFTLNPETQQWEFGEVLLSQFVLMAADDDGKRRQTMRLFLLHEAIHEQRQALRRELATGVGQFPKTIEEIDYHADVWGLCHELHRSIQENGPDARPVALAKEMIQNILRSFIAFDRAAADADIQVRRLNRYLIWLWQLVRIERLTQSATTHEIVSILLNKPVIEVSGLDIKTRSNRHFIQLNPDKLNLAEVGMYFDGKFKRFRADATIKILEGLRNFNISDMLDGVRGIHATVE